MNGKDCRIARQEIDQSELGQRLSEHTEAHVASCPNCATFRNERVRLRELVGSLRPVTAPADFDVRLRARMARERSEPRQPFIFRVVMSTPAVAVGAAVVILVAAYVWIGQRNHTVTPPQAAATNEPSQSAAPHVAVSSESPNTSQSPNPLLAADARQPGPRSRKQIITAVKDVKDFPQAGDFSARSAQQVKLGPDRNGEVSLTAPANPMVVSVFDEHGRERKILLPPISFGAQRFTDTRTPVSMKNSRDW